MKTNHFPKGSPPPKCFGKSWDNVSPVRYAKFESIRYFIDIDILQNCLIDIDIFQNHHIDIDIDIDIFQNHLINIDIDIDIFGSALSISISIPIFFRNASSISIFFKSVDISTIDIQYRYIEQGYLGVELCDCLSFHENANQ